MIQPCLQNVGKVTEQQLKNIGVFWDGTGKKNGLMKGGDKSNSLEVHNLYLKFL